jgi:hypothetical protein
MPVKPIPTNVDHADIIVREIELSHQGIDPVTARQMAIDEWIADDLKRSRRAWLAAMVTGALALVALVTVTITAAQSADGYSDFFENFLPKECCWTNRCCFRIDRSDVVDLGEDKFRVQATGQVVRRKAYSPDGEYYRCACDYEHRIGGGKYVVHPKANTRCLAVPFQGN